MSATVSGHLQFGNEDQGQVVPGTYSTVALAEYLLGTKKCYDDMKKRQNWGVFIRGHESYPGLKTSQKYMSDRELAETL